MFVMRRFLSRCAIGAAIVSPFASHAFAQSSADSVVSYNAVNAPPTFGGGTYNVSSGALGLPTADTGFGDLTPFNGAFDVNQITGIGDGGSLVLHMSQPVRTNGVTLGVHSASGLIESPFGSGHTTNPAATYTDPRVATISVSNDGNAWVSLGQHEFDNPTNYYAQGVTTPDFDTTVGTPANFFQPFTGTLSDFSDKDWPGLETVLNGSAGGDWFDLSGTGLPEVNFVKFDVSGSGNKMFVDSVLGLAVPEPTLIGFAAATLLAGRRRR
jgi:hypothetical protein